jgi:hypothetical protein
MLTTFFSAFGFAAFAPSVTTERTCALNQPPQFRCCTVTERESRFHGSSESKWCHVETQHLCALMRHGLCAFPTVLLEFGLFGHQILRAPCHHTDIFVSITQKLRRFYDTMIPQHFISTSLRLCFSAPSHNSANETPRLAELKTLPTSIDATFHLPLDTARAKSFPREMDSTARSFPIRRAATLNIKHISSCLSVHHTHL